MERYLFSVMCSARLVIPRLAQRAEGTSQRPRRLRPCSGSVTSDLWEVPRRLRWLGMTARETANNKALPFTFNRHAKRIYQACIAGDAIPQNAARARTWLDTRGFVFI